MPAESKVDVAEPPKYALVKTERSEVEALATESELDAPVNESEPETVRSPVTVVVARLVAPEAESVVAETDAPESEPPEIVASVMVPPEMAVPVMVPPEKATSESWSILFVNAMVFTTPPEAGGVET